MAANQQRFLLITYPIQGHINPALMFAKRLITMGVDCTFATTVYLHRRLINKPTVPGLSFATFSDGYDDGMDANFDDGVAVYMSELKRRCSESLRDIVTAAKEEGKPFTCLVYTFLLPWVATVARGLNLPSVLLWSQAATVFHIYYHYFNERGDYIREKSADPTSTLELPGLPYTLKPRDLPSFLLPTNTYAFALPSFKEHLQELALEANPTVLVNSFDELEADAIRSVGKLRVLPVGPLIPSAFLDGKDPADKSRGGDIMTATDDGYLEWLNSQPESSVVYVSFGTLAVLSKKQMEEIAHALLDSEFPFLWVIREKVKEKDEEEEEEDELEYCMEELKQKGKIVKWCSQLEVLSHPSLGCFVTHCGWNSTTESLASGVPTVAFPQWTDQTTGAKMMEDVWKTGVRLDDKVSEDGIIRADVIKKSLEVVLGKGEKREEIKNNAKKWKGLAREAWKEGGSSDKNLKTFLNDLAAAAAQN